MMSRFIKRLLRVTKLPLLSLASDGDYIVENIFYIYKDDVIKCTHTGFLGADANYEFIHKHDSFGDINTYNYHSKFLYYDPDTHIQLGEYLRYLKHQRGLNLMPFYNCYTDVAISGITLTTEQGKNGYKLETSSQYKLMAIPVKYGKTYTIALDSDAPVLMRTIEYNLNSGIVKPSHLSSSTYTDQLQNDLTVKPFSTFKKPFTITIPIPRMINNMPNIGLLSQERNLYFVIQVPATNDSSLTVLEGDFSESWTNAPINFEKFDTETDTANTRFLNLSLLHFNCKKSYAFSDRLIEYLLHNNINPLEDIDENIAYVQSLLNKKHLDAGTSGIWSSKIPNKLTEIGKSVIKNEFMRDLDGNLNVDLERVLLR